jgi:hypothetical protein
MTSASRAAPAVGEHHREGVAEGHRDLHRLGQGLRRGRVGGVKKGPLTALRCKVAPYRRRHYGVYSWHNITDRAGPQKPTVAPDSR